MSRNKYAELCNPHAAEGSCGMRIVKEGEEEILQGWVTEGLKVFGSYGLVVLHANDDKQQFQHGWSDLYYPIEKLQIYRERKRDREKDKKPLEPRQYKAIKAIRNCREIEERLWLIEHNIIDEIDIYAWFDDMVWRQNNLTAPIETPEVINGLKTIREDGI